MRLEGKVALVTGGATGIGRGICERFAKEGTDIVVDYVGGSDQADSLVQRVKQAGHHAVAIEADISKAQDVAKLFEQAIGQMGRIDILVNNAGIEKRIPFLETPIEEYDKIMAVNLRGAFLCAQAAARDMVKRKQGRIINISSIHEDLPFPGYTPYCASKGGMRMLMRNIAVELAPEGITVNNIAPGAIATPINTATLQNPELVRELNAIIPAGHMGTPADVAAVAVFLASDEAAYVTGSTYFVDGGMIRFARSL
ncbi:MAG TPA: glucose 1-dehydrogenase [Dehalococcoidia bacterium]|jgi:glucose 1-dehydrogenase